MLTLTEHTHVLDYSMSVFSTPRYGPLIFEMKYETRIAIMNYAALITGNSQSYLLVEVWLFIPKIPSQLLTNTLDCFVPPRTWETILLKCIF